MNIRSSIRVPVMLVFILTVSVPLFLFLNQSTALAQSADGATQSADAAESAAAPDTEQIRGLILTATDTSISDGGTVTFVASVENGNDIDWMWDFDDGLGPRRLPGANKLSRVDNYTFNLSDPSEPQTFTVRLTTKNAINSITVSVNIEVSVQKPEGLTVNHQANGGTVGVAYTFVASVQKGKGVTYDWDFGDGRIIKNGPAQIVHTYREQDIYPLSVVAKNKGGQTPYQETISIVSAAPTRCSFIVSGRDGQGRGLVDRPLTFTPDSDGSGMTYIWDFGDGRTETISGKTSISHTYTREDEYTVRLICSNISGRQNASQALTIVPEPDVAIPARGINLTTSSPVTAQTDANHRIVFAVESGAATQLTYLWDFGDGNHEITKKATISHRYTSTGRYIASVTAYNSVSRDAALVSVHVGGPETDVNNDFVLRYRLAVPRNLVRQFPVVGETVRIFLEPRQDAAEADLSILSHPNTTTEWSVSGQVVGFPEIIGGARAIPEGGNGSIDVKFPEEGSSAVSVKIMHNVNGEDYVIANVATIVSIGEDLSLPFFAR